MANKDAGEGSKLNTESKNISPAVRLVILSDIAVRASAQVIHDNPVASAEKRQAVLGTVARSEALLQKNGVFSKEDPAYQQTYSQVLAECGVRYGEIGLTSLQNISLVAQDMLRTTAESAEKTATLSVDAIHAQAEKIKNRFGAAIKTQKNR